MRLVSSRLTAEIPYHKSTIDNVVDSRKSEALKEAGIKYDAIDNDVEFSKPKSEALKLSAKLRKVDSGDTESDAK